MIRYGAAAQKMRPMTSDDHLISRLKLLIIMAKARLKGYPMGDFRRSAIVENARFVFYAALARARATGAASSAPSASKTSVLERHHPEHLLLQRVQLLAVMMGAFAQGRSRGRFRKKAMAENIEQISYYLADGFQLSSVQFLKVA